MSHVRTTLILTALAAAAGAPARPAWADPGVSAQVAAEPEPENHAPVTLWLWPQVGSAGLTSGRLRTNLALSLGASAYARLDGLDLGIGASWVTEDVRGAQVTVGLTYAGRDARGAQIAAGANLAHRRMTGVQAAAGANVTEERMAGVQVAAGANYGREVAGVQVALVNVGGQVRGAQIGLVNVAGGVKGAQIGLVNVAHDSTVPIGLVNLISDGQHALEAWASDSAPLNLGLKLGGRHVYTILAAGLAPSDEHDRWMAGLGLGGHVPIGPRAYLEPEVITYHVNEGWSFERELRSLTSLRLLGGVRLRRGLSVFAGPTLNLLVTRDDGGEGFGLIRGVRLTSEDSETTVRAWPGFVAGIRI